MASNFVAPGQHRNLRACMVCSIVQPHAKFLAEGCPNCEDFLMLQKADDKIRECTSQVYEGLITLNNAEQSWVAKWQRLEGYVSGVYAVKVVGRLPDDIVADIEEAGVKYLPRDGSDPSEEPAMGEYDQ